MACEYCTEWDDDNSQPDLPMHGNSIGTESRIVVDDGCGYPYILIEGAAINGSCLIIPIRNCPMCGEKLGDTHE